MPAKTADRLSVSELTPAPAIRPMTTWNGQSSGLFVTLTPAVGLMDGRAVRIPHGAVLTAFESIPASAAYGRRPVKRCRIGLDGPAVEFPTFGNE